MIDGTKISMTYSRPRARGRDTLFGNPKAVHWGEVWTPGANYATTFEVNRPVTLDGHAVKAGTYSVWMVVRQSGPWTMVLDPKVRYHTDPPDSNATQIRFPVTTRGAIPRRAHLVDAGASAATAARSPCSGRRRVIRPTSTSSRPR